MTGQPRENDKKVHIYLKINLLIISIYMLKLISECLLLRESNNAGGSVVIKVLAVQLYIPANSWMI
ncbi:hypothetical protein SAMN04488122_2947 [Chitinophaga arvensicola]|uniref:Uncharacterized protein n=1 Tax=Chitinophaga arvensicola TaxID=29529 RepID=A0A1I0RK96_9BACT|nr:hypothetical protein SAMN04488122_2947 [Chitinophaga arvensicola]